MRYLTGHQVNPANDVLEIEVVDEPGAGGACHDYRVIGNERQREYTRLEFQNGPINEVGVNGITHEVLLAVLIDRLECFQAGPFACGENALALTKMQEAQMWLLHRTRARMDRGVEGTHKR